MLLCDDETNPEYGDDEIRLEVNVDGGGFQTRGNASFDCNSKPHPRPWDTKLGGVIRFLEGIQFRLFEGDAASADDSSGVLVPDTTVFDRTDRPVGPVASHLPFEFDGGKYFFHFHFSKWRVQ